MQSISFAILCHFETRHVKGLVMTKLKMMMIIIIIVPVSLIIKESRNMKIL